MSPLDIARQKVIAAACLTAGSRAMREVLDPTVDSSADLELDYEMLDSAIGEYAMARSAELEGLELGG